MVGSLLRPAELKEAPRRFDAGEIGVEELRQVQEAQIRQAVAMQEDVGLPVVTDGEFRRLNFQDLVTADDQRRKLERVVEIARQVWN